MLEAKGIEIARSLNEVKSMVAHSGVLADKAFDTRGHPKNPLIEEKLIALRKEVKEKEIEYALENERVAKDNRLRSERLAASEAARAEKQREKQAHIDAANAYLQQEKELKAKRLEREKLAKGVLVPAVEVAPKSEAEVEVETLIERVKEIDSDLNRIRNETPENESGLPLPGKTVVLPKHRQRSASKPPGSVAQTSMPLAQPPPSGPRTQSPKKRRNRSKRSSAKIPPLGSSASL